MTDAVPIRPIAIAARAAKAIFLMRHLPLCATFVSGPPEKASGSPHRPIALIFGDGPIALMFGDGPIALMFGDGDVKCLLYRTDGRLRLRSSVLGSACAIILRCNKIVLRCNKGGAVTLGLPRRCAKTRLRGLAGPLSVKSGIALIDHGMRKLWSCRRFTIMEVRSSKARYCLRQPVPGSKVPIFSAACKVCGPNSVS